MRLWFVSVLTLLAPLPALATPLVAFGGFEVPRIVQETPIQGMETCVLSDANRELFEFFVAPVSTTVAMMVHMDEITISLNNEPKDTGDKVQPFSIMHCEDQQIQWLGVGRELTELAEVFTSKNGLETLQAWISDIVLTDFVWAETRQNNLAQECACKYMASENWARLQAARIIDATEQLSGDN